ncbi:GNAT family N-acetyltransferase [Stagnihabitans tardus]|uniref:GNAT family N-acetyltransferase n=1 Tax=Stagnihabitans tardus TaxID=2699202 RepID=A0AAE4Y8P2_9RHOB|nr:GNAT family N-acetyltransferase [Stagnihabitans tardus]NBZ87988.1 GNAT family N-acetyltransferase [Stagnihabitans tardus]
MTLKLQAPILTLGRLSARLLPPDADLTEVLALRHLAFRGGEGLESDPYDPLCRHLVISAGESLVATARLQDFAPGSDRAQSYAAAFYDLSPLAREGASLELGRFCLHPRESDPGILRLAFGLVARLAREEAVTLIFGSSSFPGASADHGAALAALRPHVADPSPGRRAAETLPLPAVSPDPLRLPPLLRFYLALGARVSDHAVVDRDLDTLHVLTLLRPADIPPARLRALLGS